MNDLLLPRYDRWLDSPFQTDMDERSERSEVDESVDEHLQDDDEDED